MIVEPARTSADGARARARRPPGQRDQARARARRARAVRRAPRRSRPSSGRPASSARSACPSEVEILLDAAVASGPRDGAYVTGAGRADEHLRGVVPGRDFSFREVDVRSVVEGDTIGGEPVTIEPAIEVGNIFKLGTRYSEPLRRHATSTSRAASSRSGWAATGSARRGSSPPRSSSTPTSTASPGRARWRRSTSTWSRSARPARPSARRPTALYGIAAQRSALEVLYDDRDLGAGREVRRRRAARLPAAADRRAPLAGVRRDRGPDPPRPRAGAAAAARRRARAAARRAWTSCGRASPRAAAGGPPAGRTGPRAGGAGRSSARGRPAGRSGGVRRS